MEDPTPPSNVDTPLPEAGHDPQDPLRPEVEEENSADAPIGNPTRDMDLAEEGDKSGADDDVEDDNDKDDDKDDDKDNDNANDNDNDNDKENDSDALSELDEAEIDELEDFDANKIALEDRPIAVDETNVALLGVHKRKRAEGEEGGARKKKREGRREKPKKSKKKLTRGGDDDDANFSGGEQLDGKRTRKRKEVAAGGEGGRKKRVKAPVNEDELTPQERARRELYRKMDEALRGPNRRGRKKNGIDLETMQDAEIEAMRRRMTEAAQADLAGCADGQPAYHKLTMLPEVVELLNRNTIQHNLVDPDSNLLEAVRFFLEPLGDGSMPAYNIQRDLFACLARLPIKQDALVASGLGKVAWFYTKTKKCEPGIKRAAEKLIAEWTRPILRKSGDYKKMREGAEGAAAVHLSTVPSAEDLARARVLDMPNEGGRARAAVGPMHAYTIVPKRTVIPANTYRPGASGADAFRRMKARHAVRR